jgi:hypothetical protein
MRIPTCRWPLLAAVVVLAAAPIVLAEDETPSDNALLSRELVDALKDDSCGLLEEIFTKDDPSNTCSKLRKPNRELRVVVTLREGDNLVELTKFGQRCRDGIVAADVRPKKSPRWVSYVAVSLEARDGQSLRFAATTAKTLHRLDGGLVGIGGCGPVVVGAVRFVNGKWHLLHRRAEGCSE